MEDSAPTETQPDHGCDLNVWLKDNWDTLHALARAQQLPVLAPPRSNDENSPADDDDPFAFDPVPLRSRLDGWTAERQVAFIEALAESACVADACRAVKMSKQSAYALRARPEAFSFRNAWDAALEFATGCLADEVLSRAVNGVVVPVFYQGEQIGKKRVYDERLAMFLLQRRDPLRYGQWRDKAEWSGHPEGSALALLRAKAAVREDAEKRPEELAASFGQRLRSILDGLRHAERNTVR